MRELMSNTSDHSVPSSATVQLLQTGELLFENHGAGKWVDVVAHPSAKTSFCDDNVALQIRDHGGQGLHVWDVTESGPFVEMEAHIVWRGPDGRLLDVSPSLIGATRHFVIPSELTFARPFPGNVLLSLSTDPSLREFALYSSWANAAIAPHRTVGQMIIKADVLRIWAREFVDKNCVKCDFEKLVRTCYAVLLPRGGQ